MQCIPLQNYMPRCWNFLAKGIIRFISQKAMIKTTGKLKGVKMLSALEI